MKKTVSVMLVLCTFLSVVLLGVLPASAASGRVGDCTWTLDGTTLTIGGSGDTGKVNGTPWGTNVTKILVKAGVTSLDEGIFVKCTRLTDIQVETKNPSYKAVGGVLFNKGMTRLIAFPREKQGRSYIVPSTVTSIGRDAFSNARFLETVQLPDTITRIGLNAFQATNMYYSGKQRSDGAVYIGNYLIGLTDRAMTELTVREGTRVVAEGACIGQPNLESVILPDGVLTIEDNSFSWCGQLQCISIPESVTYVGNSAFYDCMALEQVFYRGEESASGRIFFDEMNDALIDAEWYYDACYAAPDHIWKDYFVVTPSDCENDGLTEYVCGICQTTVLDVIPAHHVLGEWKVERASTCVEGGLEARACMGCDWKETRPLETTEHTFGEYEVVKQPTLLSRGVQKSSCRVCGAVKSEILPRTEPTILTIFWAGVISIVLLVVTFVVAFVAYIIIRRRKRA